jgi:hypothetical protein
VFRAEALSLVVEAAGEFASNYEFQLVAGTFHEDIDDFAAATKYSSSIVRFDSVSYAQSGITARASS